MARFDDDFLRRLKEETDLVRLIESYGTRLKDRGGGKGEMIGLCPVHDARTLLGQVHFRRSSGQSK